MTVCFHGDSLSKTIGNSSEHLKSQNQNLVTFQQVSFDCLTHFCDFLYAAMPPPFKCVHFLNDCNAPAVITPESFDSVIQRLHAALLLGGFFWVKGTIFVSRKSVVFPVCISVPCGLMGTAQQRVGSSQVQLLQSHK